MAALAALKARIVKLEQKLNPVKGMNIQFHVLHIVDKYDERRGKWFVRKESGWFSTSNAVDFYGADSDELDALLNEYRLTNNDYALVSEGSGFEFVQLPPVGPVAVTNV